jgi:hypothetical protein
LTSAGQRVAARYVAVLPHWGPLESSAGGGN